MATDSLLRGMVDLRDRQIQKGRIQFDNRLRALESGADNGTGHQIQIVEKWAIRFTELEAELTRDIAHEVEQYKMYPYLSSVKGIGPGLTAKLLALIDIERSNTVSQLWRFAGLAVFNGKREYRVKGETSHYNSRLKSVLYNVWESLMRTKDSPYNDIYYHWKAKYAETRPEWTLIHQHKAAIRKVEKMFLSHLWYTWRVLEGLPVLNLWVIEHLGHQTYESPEKYGWKSVSHLPQIEHSYKVNVSD